MSKEEREEPVVLNRLAPGQLLSTEAAAIMVMAPSRTDVLRWAAGLDPDFPATPQEARAQRRQRKGREGLKFEFRVGK